MICLDLKNFPLQILARKFPKSESLAVVKDDRPQGIILFLNDAARKRGIRIGTTYAAAVSLDPFLTAGTVSGKEIAKELAGVLKLLHRFSMKIESDAQGAFWIEGACDPGKIRKAVPFEASIAAGFTKFGTFAAAKATTGITTFSSREEERATVLQIPILHFLPPDTVDLLRKLKIRTLGEYLRFSPGDLLERFGREAWSLHAMTAGLLDAPLNPTPEEVPLRKTLALEDPIENREELLFVIKSLLNPLLEELRLKGQGLTRLELALENRIEILSPATATLDIALLLELLRLRLQRLDGPLSELSLTVAGERITTEQLSLFRKPQADLRKAEEVLAQIRSRFGNESVVKAELRDEHLPESKFEWVPLQKLAHPVTRPGNVIRARRIFTRPRPIGGFCPQAAPSILSGGWWNKPFHREYFIHDNKWIFYDRIANRWYQHGTLE